MSGFRLSISSISSTISAGLQFCQIGRNCRRYRKPTIPTFPADYRNSRKSMLSISSTIPADLSELPEMSKADHSGIFGRYKFCRNCRSFAGIAGIIENFLILDMYDLEIKAERNHFQSSNLISIHIFDLVRIISMKNYSLSLRIHSA